MTRLKITCAEVAGYRQRTIDNANAGDLTIAVALDHHTAGERLTAKAAGRKLMSIDPRMWAPGPESLEAVDRVYRDAQGWPTINIAGNSLATLGKHGWDQRRCNRFMRRLFLAFPCEPLLIRSGGQTGMDLAGIVAAVSMGWNAHAHMPKGYMMRGANGLDYVSSEQNFRDIVTIGVEDLLGQRG